MSEQKDLTFKACDGTTVYRTPVYNRTTKLVLDKVPEAAQAEKKKTTKPSYPYAFKSVAGTAQFHVFGTSPGRWYDLYTTLTDKMEAFLDSQKDSTIGAIEDALTTELLESWVPADYKADLDKLVKDGKEKTRWTKTLSSNLFKSYRNAVLRLLMNESVPLGGKGNTLINVWSGYEEEDDDDEIIGDMFGDF